jgi:hypothetical protein
MRIQHSVVAVLLVACSTSPNGPSHGSEGRAEFAWDVGVFGCLFGCDASAPMVTRGVANLEIVNADELPALTVESSDPTLVEFTLVDSTTIRCDGRAAGKATVTLRDAASGELVDRFGVRAEDVQSIAPADATLFRDRLLVVPGTEVEIDLALTGTSGKHLVGIGGVDYTLAGLDEAQVTLASALADLIVSILAGTSTEYVRFDALALGDGGIHVAAPSGATLDIPAAVVDASVVTDIAVAPRGPLPPGSGIIVDANATTAGERVHGAPCAWSLSPADGPIQIDWTGPDYMQVKANAAGEATLTCTVGGASGSVQMIAK